MNQQEFSKALETYADIIVNIGLNLQKEQRLEVTAGLQDAELVRLIAKKAYQLGVPYVDVRWNDEKLTRIRFDHARPETLTEIPDWLIAREHEYGQRGDAYLSFASSDPNLLEGVNPDLISAHRKALAQKFEPTYKYINENKVNWCVVSTATPAWSKKVFPDLDEKQAQEKLWEAIFESCRVNLGEPVKAWRDHSQNLQKRSKFLNDKQYISLEYKSPTTDLKVGLPKNHVWIGGSSTTVSGIEFIPNLPTEEVFCLPHREKVDGYISSTMPLVLSGSLIEDFTLAFENGRVTKVTAKKGEENIQKLLETDENASRLGEVALVPHSSPISQRKHLFYNTLFDENAASHIALGRAYRDNVVGGESMSKEEFMANGGNDSLIHVDFMVGSDKLDIDGICADGTREPIMRKGEWAFEI